MQRTDLDSVAITDYLRRLKAIHSQKAYSEADKLREFLLAHHIRVGYQRDGRIVGEYYNSYFKIELI